MLIYYEATHEELAERQIGGNGQVELAGDEREQSGQRQLSVSVAWLVPITSK